MTAPLLTSRESSDFARKIPVSPDSQVAYHFVRTDPKDDGRDRAKSNPATLSEDDGVTRIACNFMWSGPYTRFASFNILVDCEFTSPIQYRHLSIKPQPVKPAKSLLHGETLETVPTLVPAIAGLYNGFWAKKSRAGERKKVQRGFLEVS